MLFGIGDVLVISCGDQSKMANRVMGYVICGYNSVDNLMVSGSLLFMVMACRHAIR